MMRPKTPPAVTLGDAVRRAASIRRRQQQREATSGPSSNGDQAETAASADRSSSAKHELPSRPKPEPEPQQEEQALQPWQLLADFRSHLHAMEDAIEDGFSSTSARWESDAEAMHANAQQAEELERALQHAGEQVEMKLSNSRVNLSTVSPQRRINALQFQPPDQAVCHRVPCLPFSTERVRPIPGPTRNQSAPPLRSQHAPYPSQVFLTSQVLSPGAITCAIEWTHSRQRETAFAILRRPDRSWIWNA
ncbi:hypothetical protein V8E36_003604 [Tilletia maclaganii]